MLAPGVVWTAAHGTESKPMTPVEALADIALGSAQLSARRGADGTPYCIACDTVLRPPRGGRQKALCAKHDAARGGQRLYAHRAKPRPTEFHVTLSNADCQQLLQSLDNLARAVGKAASYFEPEDEQTWSHDLLLAAKQLTRVTDDHLRPAYNIAAAANHREDRTMP